MPPRPVPTLAQTSPFDGALLVDKPSGPTSHDVVDRLRRHLGIKRLVTAGRWTRWPPGLLVILLGRGTKLSEQLMSSDKVYVGEVRFGETTDSFDAEGEMVTSLPVPPMTLETLNESAAGFVGDLMQKPPMVSAVKLKGVPLYKLARKGMEVEREARLVHVYSFRFTRYEEPLGVFRLACTKGTGPSGPSPTISVRNSAAAPTCRLFDASIRDGSASRNPPRSRTCWR